MKKKPFKNIVGKGENTDNQHFLLFPQVLYPSQKEFVFSSHEHGVLSELLWSLTVRRCPSVHQSVHNLLVNTLASTNINQSSPNLVKMYMTTRARMSSIMEPIRPERSELSALEFENLPYLTMFTL